MYSTAAARVPVRPSYKLRMERRSAGAVTRSKFISVSLFVLSLKNQLRPVVNKSNADRYCKLRKLPAVLLNTESRHTKVDTLKQPHHKDSNQKQKRCLCLDVVESVEIILTVTQMEVGHGNDVHHPYSACKY